LSELAFADQLQGGDRRSLGCANQVAGTILANPSRLQELLSCCLAPSPIIRSRASHALMTIARQKPELLQPHTGFFLNEVMPLSQWEVRSHFCQTITRLALAPREIDRLLSGLQDYFSDKSSIVRTCAMQAMVDLCQQTESLAPQIRPIIAEKTASGTAAMRARGRQLLKVLDRDFPG